jgi:hypothetical protein
VKLSSPPLLVGTRWAYRRLRVASRLSPCVLARAGWSRRPDHGRLWRTRAVTEVTEVPIAPQSASKIQITRGKSGDGFSHSATPPVSPRARAFDQRVQLSVLQRLRSAERSPGPKRFGVHRRARAVLCTSPKNRRRPTTPEERKRFDKDLHDLGAHSSWHSHSPSSTSMTCLT